MFRRQEYKGFVASIAVEASYREQPPLYAKVPRNRAVCEQASDHSVDGSAASGRQKAEPARTFMRRPMR